VNRDPRTTVILIDGSSFLYRAYYGVRPLHTSRGEPVQAVYAFCRMLKKIIDQFNPSYIALVWDSKGKTTRHQMLESYKATRQAAPSDLFEQKKYIVEFADLIGMRQVAQDGIEADDLMYSIAQEQKKEGNSIIVITSDKDMGQMIDSKTVMFDAFKDVIYDVPTFEKRMGFPVAKLPFYFALLGDTSDNIPGVKGIGKTTALDLVTQYDSLDDLYAHISRVTLKRAKTALEHNKENAFLSYNLFLLQYHPTGLTQEDFKFTSNNWCNARSLFEKLEFYSLLADIDRQFGPQIQTSGKLGSTVIPSEQKMIQYDFRLITTKDQLMDLCALIKKYAICALDTETTGVNPLDTQLVGLSFCVEVGQSFYIPCGHITEQKQLARDIVLAELKPILEDLTIKKYLHNSKFDQLVLSQYGVEINGLACDTMIAARLLLPETQSVGLKQLSIALFDEPMLTYDEVIKHNKYKDFSYVPLELALRYAAADAHQTLKLAHKFIKDLATEKLDKLYYSIEHPLIQILYKMEKEGIYIDVDHLHELNKSVTKALRVIEEHILTYVAEEKKSINLNSPKQIEYLLFTQLRLPPQKKSGKGLSYSTDQEVLTALATMHPVPGLILKYRELFKLKSTYIEALPTYVNPKDGRVHTTYSQTAVATGRLASSDPNLQNIPADMGYGAQVRAAFIPRSGHLFLSADYSQIELRVLAQFSGDKNLTHAFLSGHDIHAQTTARLFDIPLADVTHEQRQIGKRINFSILYGLTPYGLSKDMNISMKEAKNYIEKYFEQYPAVREWMESVVEFTKEHGYCVTMFGRRRYIPGIYERNKTLHEQARRMAINSPAQGTASEVMKIGMINLNKALAEHNLQAKILLQIHDELLISVPEQEIEQTQTLVKNILESVVAWNIPLKVAVGYGRNWKEIEK